jgi:GTP pyrophosphokinase
MCCCPVPGDNIVGIVTQTRGITVHRSDCPNYRQSRSDRRVSVTGGGRSGIRYTTRLRVEGSDRPSIFGDIGQAITLMDGHILNIRGGVADSARTRFMIDLQVLDIEHLYRIIAKINTMPGIIEVTRG